jgi:hypothetical protein
MMKLSPAIAVLLILSMSRLAAAAEDPYHPTMTSCEMIYNLKGWSVIYKTSKGEGRITCSNGQAADVAIKTHGGGFTVGKSEIIGGKGKFSEVRSIDALFGTYAVAEAHAGATKSAGAQAMTKGEVSLSLVGTGQGVDVGFSFGGFTIERK